jgi:hypothetical protein
VHKSTSKEWLRLFSLISGLMAMKEGCPSVPDVPENLSELLEILKPLAAEAQHKIAAYRDTLWIADDMRNHPESEYYLLTLILDEAERGWGIKGYRRERLEEANRDYAAAEASGVNAVLVSTESLATLWAAYPNYRLDLGNFTRLLYGLSGWERVDSDFDFFNWFMR